MSDEGSNLGLLVTVRSLAGIQMDLKTVRFASGRDHHHSKQPMLVLFTDDGRRATSQEGSLKGTGEILLITIFSVNTYHKTKSVISKLLH